MKILVFWVILLTGSYIIPASMQSPFLWGLAFGIVWTYWVSKG